jgi:L-histidine Nalpha-methyltransferase
MNEPIQIELTEADLAAALRADAARGLTDTPKWLPPKWFYDARGSELFELITELPEYYPARTERALLQRVAGEIACAASDVEVLIELGSGSSEKTRLLLSALTADGSLKMYVPQDVSATALESAAPLLAAQFPGIAVRPVISDFTDTLRHLPGGGRRMIAFLGGTIGNLTPSERAEFFGGVHDVLEPGERLLLGAALVTDPKMLVPAYDDAAGVTAEFNRNVLRVLNDRLGANFDPDRFDHIALWDADNDWIEMRLQSRDDVAVRIADLDLEVSFHAGEQLRTEISAKFRVDGLAAELHAAGFMVARHWTDPEQRFATILAARLS